MKTQEPQGKKRRKKGKGDRQDWAEVRVVRRPRQESAQEKQEIKLN